MKVLQLISSGLGYYGAERVVVTLSSALESLGVPTVVSVFRNQSKTLHLEVAEKARERGLATEVLNCTGRFDRSTLASLQEIIERHRVDVIHCHGIKPDLYSLLAARKLPVALVSTCHLWVFDDAKDWMISAAERLLLRKFDRVIAVSDSISPLLRRFGIPNQVIHNGIETDPYLGPFADLRTELGWGNRPVIGALGRLAAQKGLPYLLRAAPGVLHQHPDALFVFVGDGPELDALQTEATTLGVDHAVRFLGVRDDIPSVLASLDLLAMPSLSEGLPMALLEAMASGRAVVASSVGAIPQVVQHGVNGLLIDVSDVAALTKNINDLLASPALRIELGRAARSTVESRFSANAMALQYLEIYRQASLCKSGARQGLEGVRQPM